MSANLFETLGKIKKMKQFIGQYAYSVQNGKLSNSENWWTLSRRHFENGSVRDLYFVIILMFYLHYLEIMYDSMGMMF